MTPSRAGFSLIELVMVIVVIAIAAVGIGAAFSRMSGSLALNEDLQRAAQVAQECAEHILARARPPQGHFSAITAAAPSAECNAMAAGGFTRVVNVSNMPTGGALCDAGWNCKRVQVSVSKGSAVVEVNLMLVQY